MHRSAERAPEADVDDGVLPFGELRPGSLREAGADLPLLDTGDLLQM